MSSTAVPRKYPRAEIDQPGVLSVRMPSLQETRRVPVAIRSISCEGVGLVLGSERCPLERRATVTMDFIIEGFHYQIPGLIVWVAPPTAKGPLDVGVKFQLAAVTNETRQAYARWIVSFLRSKGAA